MADIENDIVYRGRWLVVRWRPRVHWFAVMDPDGQYVTQFRYGWPYSIKGAKKKAIDYVNTVEKEALE